MNIIILNLVSLIALISLWYLSFASSGMNLILR